MAKETAKKVQTAGNPFLDVGSTKKVKKPIRCGIVGLGRIGWEHHAQIIMQHGGFELAAVCDLEEDRLQEAKQAANCATYMRLEEMLKDEVVELVVGATPPG